MALGGEVRHPGGLVFAEDHLERGPVGDVRAHEVEARQGLEVAQALEAAGVGQLVDHHDARRARREHQAHEVRADEAGASGDEDAIHGQPSPAASGPGRVPDSGDAGNGAPAAQGSKRVHDGEARV